MALYFHINDEEFLTENQGKIVHDKKIEFVQDIQERWVINVLAVEGFNGTFTNTSFPILNLQTSDFPIGEDPLNQ